MSEYRRELKTRMVAIPIPTWKHLKRTSAELETPIGTLLADAWINWAEQNAIEKRLVLAT